MAALPSVDLGAWPLTSESMDAALAVQKTVSVGGLGSGLIGCMVWLLHDGLVSSTQLEHFRRDHRCQARTPKSL